jgi:pimeloyl-ACP methyl ester carboxylesterase
MIRTDVSPVSLISLFDYQRLAKTVLRSVCTIAVISLLTLCLSSENGWASGKGVEQPGENQVKESFQFGDVAIKYTVSGQGEPLLFIHGFGVSSYSWRHVAGTLSQFYKVTCVDLKGFGDSDKPDNSDYSAYGQAQILAAFLEQQDVRGVTLIGNSFGGRVAMDLFAQPPATGRVKRLVMIDNASPDAALAPLIRLARTPPVPSILSSLLPASSIANTMLKSAFYDDALIEADARRVYSAQLSSPGAIGAFAKTAPLVFAADPREEIWGTLDRVNVPTLIIWGDHDAVIPEVNGRKLNARLPNSRFVLFEECGHMPQEEKPRETIGAIMQFLQRVR